MIAFAIDSNLLAAARDLCADSGDTNPEYVRGIAELIIDSSYGLTQDEHKDLLIEFLGAPTVDPNAPLTDDQRRALFAAYGDAFRDTTNEGRYSFTRLVLGLDPLVLVSWTARSDYAITTAEADKVLAALRAQI